MKYVDKVLCIFPFEVEMYKKAGIDVHYCGHPLVKQLPQKADKEDFFQKHGLDINKPLVSVFSGSRPLELYFLAKTFLKSADILKTIIGFILVKRGTWVQNITFSKNQ